MPQTKNIFLAILHVYLHVQQHQLCYQYLVNKLTPFGERHLVAGHMGQLKVNHYTVSKKATPLITPKGLIRTVIEIQNDVSWTQMGYFLFVKDIIGPWKGNWIWLNIYILLIFYMYIYT